jgi:hypothetical protein
MIVPPVVSTRVWPVHMAARIGPVQVIAPQCAATGRAGHLRERHGAGRDRSFRRASTKARRLFAVRSHRNIVVIWERVRNRQEARVHF